MDTTRATIAIAQMRALTAATSAAVHPSLSLGQRERRRQIHAAPTPLDRCTACGDAAGVRCCEFGRDS